MVFVPHSSVWKYLDDSEISTKRKHITRETFPGLETSCFLLKIMNCPSVGEILGPHCSCVTPRRYFILIPQDIRAMVSFPPCILHSWLHCTILTKLLKSWPDLYLKSSIESLSDIKRLNSSRGERIEI